MLMSANQYAVNPHSRLADKLTHIANHPMIGFPETADLLEAAELIRRLYEQNCQLRHQRAQLIEQINHLPAELEE